MVNKNGSGALKRRQPAAMSTSKKAPQPLSDRAAARSIAPERCLAPDLRSCRPQVKSSLLAEQMVLAARTGTSAWIIAPMLLVQSGDLALPRMPAESKGQALPLATQKRRFVFGNGQQKFDRPEGSIQNLAYLRRKADCGHPRMTACARQSPLPSAGPVGPRTASNRRADGTRIMALHLYRQPDGRIRLGVAGPAPQRQTAFASE